jgi:hypothetical protein
MAHQNPLDISPRIRDWMLSLGYVPEDEVEEATGTSPRSRARWQSLKGVMWGHVKWFPLRAVKRTLDARADALDEGDEPPAAAIL